MLGWNTYRGMLICTGRGVFADRHLHGLFCSPSKQARCHKKMHGQAFGKLTEENSRRYGCIVWPYIFVSYCRYLPVPAELAYLFWFS